MSALDRALAEYSARLQSLRAWPDKHIIFEITDFCARNMHISNHLTDILTSRLIDPLTNVALKVPLFYLVDSIIKNVGGPYIDLFASHIVVAFQRIFAEVNETDKARLDYLLSTWESGMFFHRDVLLHMRSFIGRRIVCVPRPVRGGALGRGPAPPAGFLDRAPRDVSAAVRQEMLMLLDRMYADMGVRNPVPLDELSATNPQLFHQIKRDAEINVHHWMEQESARGRGGPFSPPRGLSIRAPRDGRQAYPDAMSPSLGAANKDLIKAFIAETVVSINMSQAHSVHSSLTDWADLSALPQADRDPRLLGLRAASAKVARRLDGLLSSVGEPPQLPAMLFDTVVRDTAPMGAAFNGRPLAPLLPPAPPALNRAKQKLIMPQFDVAELKRNPMKALRALYSDKDRPFYSKQDGLRFKTQQALTAHLDSLFYQNKERRSREISQSGGASAGPAVRSSRQWYLDASQWVTDCGALGGAAGSSAASATQPKGVPSADPRPSAGPAADDDEEMVVPADEKFSRCPVSHEVFQIIWDDEEGDYMYRNAVKVLLTQEADPQLYSVSHNTSQPGVRYALVHKRLVLDGWIAAGKAVALKDAMVLRKQNAEMADYAAAGNVDEDEDDVFVILADGGDAGGSSGGGGVAVAAESKMEEYDPFSLEAK